MQQISSAGTGYALPFCAVWRDPAACGAGDAETTDEDAEVPRNSASAPHAKAKASKGLLGAGAAAITAATREVGTAAIVEGANKGMLGDAVARGKSGGSGLAPPKVNAEAALAALVVSAAGATGALTTGARVGAEITLVVLVAAVFSSVVIEGAAVEEVVVFFSGLLLVSAVTSEFFAAAAKAISSSSSASSNWLAVTGAFFLAALSVVSLMLTSSFVVVNVVVVCWGEWGGLS